MRHRVRRVAASGFRPRIAHAAKIGRADTLPGAREPMIEIVFMRIRVPSTAIENE
jgi:hypothetical protein